MQHEYGVRKELILERGLKLKWVNTRIFKALIQVRKELILGRGLKLDKRRIAKETENIW